MTLIPIALFVSLFVATWSILDLLLVWITNILADHTELACDKRYVPARIAIVGPPDPDLSLRELDACGSAITEFAINPAQNPIELVWRILETAPGIVVVRDIATDSLGFAHLVRKAGYIGTVVLWWRRRGERGALYAGTATMDALCTKSTTPRAAPEACGARARVSVRKEVRLTVHIR